jgi:hypothetical protein
MFYERQHIPKLKLLLILEESQTWCNAWNLGQHKCRPLFKLTKWINVAILCDRYLPQGAFVEFFTLSCAVEGWNLLSVSLLLSLFLKSIGENMVTKIIWFLNLRHSGTPFGVCFLTSAQQLFLFSSQNIDFPFYLRRLLEFFSFFFFFSFFLCSMSWGLGGFDDIWGENHFFKNLFSNGMTCNSCDTLGVTVVATVLKQ